MSPSSSQPSQPPLPTASPSSSTPLGTSTNPPIPGHDASRPRTPQEAERFFRRIALENRPPSRTMRWLSIGGWVAGACKSMLSGFLERLISRLVNGRLVSRPSSMPGLLRSHSEAAPFSPVVSTLYYIMSHSHTKCSSSVYPLFSAPYSMPQSVAASYMVLYADFGPREHVFSPVRPLWLLSGPSIDSICILPSRTRFVVSSAPLLIPSQVCRKKRKPSWAFRLHDPYSRIIDGNRLHGRHWSRKGRRGSHVERFISEADDTRHVGLRTGNCIIDIRLYHDSVRSRCDSSVLFRQLIVVIHNHGRVCLWQLRYPASSWLVLHFSRPC